MQADSTFFIGKTHNVNQDYCQHGVKNDITYAIVSDGCSSSHNTDFGSRILTRAAIKHIERSWASDYPELVINTAHENIKALELNTNCLDATLLTLSVISGNVFVNMFGDGVCMVKRFGIEPFIVYGDYPLNAPYYLSYLLDQKRNEEYHNLTDIKNKPVFNQLYNGNIGSAVKNECWYRDCIGSMSDIEYVAVMTDGVSSFEERITSETSINSKAVAFEKICTELTAFKNSNGEFVKRRVQKAMKVFESKHYHNNDDVSIAVIHR